MRGSNLAWAALAASPNRVVLKQRVRDLALRLNLNGDTALRVLSRNERLVPLFKDYYYVKSPDEILEFAAGFLPK